MRIPALALALGLLAPFAHATGGDPACDSGDGRGKIFLNLVGLTGDGHLVCFNELKPKKDKEIGAITGLTAGDTQLVGIDFRVQDGKLWGVGNAGGLYTLDVTNGVATPAGALTVALEGTRFGVDFNPAADRLRIVSDSGQNLRHNVNAGGVTLVDAPLNYAAGVTALGIEGAAYTNNDLLPSTATSLFDLDASLDQIALQAPPNNGSLGATGKLSIGADSPAGFDIYSILDRDGLSAANRGFASWRVGGTPAFYRINLLTGASDFVGVFDRDVVDVAAPLDQ